MLFLKLFYIYNFMLCDYNSQPVLEHLAKSNGVLAYWYGHIMLEVYKKQLIHGVWWQCSTGGKTRKTNRGYRKQTNKQQIADNLTATSTHKIIRSEESFLSFSVTDYCFLGILLKETEVLKEFYRGKESLDITIVEKSIPTTRPLHYFSVLKKLKKTPTWSTGYDQWLIRFRDRAVYLQAG